MSATTEHHPLALVTGASSGIGFQLAKLFAENGFDLIIAAEDDELANAKRDLEAAGNHVEAVQVDLATETGVRELYEHVSASARPLEAAALNAGRGAGGAFATDTKLAFLNYFTRSASSSERNARAYSAPDCWTA